MEFGFEVKSCSVRWELEAPSDHSQIDSPQLQFGEDECSLRCINWYGSLWLNINSSKLNRWSVPYRVTVQVENPTTREILPSLTVTKQLFTLDGRIWSKKFYEIEEADSSFALTYEFDGEEYDRNMDLAFIVTAVQSENGTDERSVQTSLTINPIPCSESLSEDWAKLLDSDSNADVDFQCDGQSTKAHRLVVSTRSPVLANMLQSQWSEGATGIVKIEDMDLNTLRLFVRYLYTGRLAEAVTFETAMALYEAADKYQVQSLARRCAQSVIENLTVDNACNVLDIADRHSDDRFVEEITVFMLDKRVPLLSPHWQDFCNSHPLLSEKVLNRYMKKWTGGASGLPKRRHSMQLRSSKSKLQK